MAAKSVERTLFDGSTWRGGIPSERHLAIYIGNWRPISLLNVNFKILFKSLVNRLKNLMDKIIQNDQTWEIKGRTVFQNITVAQDAINFL